MLLRFDAYLNGVSFAQLDPAIILCDIVEKPPKEDRDEAKRALHPGTRISSRTRRSLPVELIFCIREYDIQARARVMDKVAEWAGDGGWLTVNTRPGQRLYVTPELPALGSSLKWTEDITLTLTAYERPYWEQQWPTTAIITESGSLCPTGTFPTAYVECDVTNTGDADLTILTLTCADTFITLEGLAVPHGEHVKVHYTDDDIFRITAAGASALANRTAESHDDLIAFARRSNAIAVAADQPVSAVFSARGRYR